MSKPVAGIIGGLGPMASAYFYDMVTRLTKASTDQDHIDMIITSTSSTPDRTSFIINKSTVSPVNSLINDAKRLEKAGASFIAMTCNTAHYFYDEISSSIDIPFINIIEETVSSLSFNNHKKVGILATSGTINTELYQRECEKQNIEYVLPTQKEQEIIMSIIYDGVKASKPIDLNIFYDVIYSLYDKGCDGVILGCTELSILKTNHQLSGKFYIDSLEALARKVILSCNKEDINSDSLYLNDRDLRNLKKFI